MRFTIIVRLVCSNGQGTGCRAGKGCSEYRKIKALLSRMPTNGSGSQCGQGKEGLINKYRENVILGWREGPLKTSIMYGTLCNVC